MTDVVVALHRLGGAATRAEVLASGVTRRAVDRAVQDGSLLSGDAAYWVPGADPVLVLASRTRSWVTCVSALARWSIPVLTVPHRPHLASTRSRSDRAACWHRVRDGAPADRGADRWTRSVDPVTAVVQAMRCLPTREGLVVADGALRARLVSRADLDRALPAHDPQGARWVLRHADRRAESVLESLLRYELVKAGLTGFVPQAELPGVGRVDFLLDGWLVLEADGYEHHSNRTEFLLDRQRLAVAARSGHVTLRFGYAAIVAHPAEVIRCIEATRREFAGGHLSTALEPAPRIGPGQRSSWTERGALMTAGRPRRLGAGSRPDGAVNG